MQQTILTPAEWNIMESLWIKAPKVGSEIVVDILNDFHNFFVMDMGTGGKVRSRYQLVNRN